MIMRSRNRGGLFRLNNRVGFFAAIALLFFSCNAAQAAITVAPTTVPGGTVSVPYNETFTASGGTGPYTFTVLSGSLPNGLTLDSSGDLTGTPTTQGVYNFTIQVTDSTSATGSRAYSMSVGTFSLAVQPNTLPNGTQGTAYSQSLSAVGGTPPYTFSVSSGSLPTGLSLSSDGNITGTPSAAGAFTFIIQALDPDGDTGYRTYNVSIGGNTITVSPSTLPNGTQGTAYSQTVSASGGNGGPYTYAISAGSLPAGLSLNTSSGVISGTPSASGAYNFTVRATDSSNNFGTQAYNVNIGGNSLTLSPTSLPNGFVSTAYDKTVTASGGTGGPYTYSVGSGSLPTGLSLNTGTGEISGTPSAAGSYSFTIHAVDGNNNFGNQNYTVNIGSNSLTVAPSTLPNGTQGTAYNQTVTASGGTSPYTYAITAGALPNGLTLATGSGVISGTPSASGTYNFTVGATDSHANTGSQAYSVTIAPVPLVVNPTTLPNGTQGTAYSQTITTQNGTGSYTYNVLSGSLPNGLSLNGSNGQISGTPTATGSYNFTIQSTDSASNTGSRAYSVTIGSNSLTLSPASLPNATQGAAYNQSVTASGGTGSFTYAVTSGALPAGLSLNSSSGAITGTPTGSGTSNFTIQATDTGGNTGSRAYSINVGTSSLTLTPTTLPNGTQGTAYSQQITASNGSGGYTYTVTAGTLPPGLTLSNAGLLSGTPTGSGNSNFTVQATDSNGDVGSQAYAVSIGTSSLTVTPATLPNGTQGIAYNQTFGASGGSGSYTYSLTSGALPAGLALSNGGVLSGTPTASGTSNFTVQATDSNGNIGSKAYAVKIGTNSLTLSPTSLPNGTQGTAYNQTVTATGGTGPYTYSVTSGALPAGLSLSNAGGLSGTPTGSGASNFTIQAMDANGNAGSQAYTVNIGTTSLTVSPTTLPNASQGKAYSQPVTASGGTGPYTLALVSGALPAGLSFNAASGIISGTPTGTGPSTFSIRATDSKGNVGNRSYTVNVGSNSLTVNPASLPSAPQGKAYNQPLTVTGATGAVVFSVISGALPAGLTLNAATGVISGTPTSGGNANFTIQARDGNGNFGTRAFTLSTSRADPTLDPDVRGLIDAQAASTRRFTDAQTSNVLRRLEGLHDGFDPCGLNFGINPTTYTAPPAYPAVGGPAGNNVFPSSNASAIPPRPATPASRCDPMSAPPIAVWASGALEFGKMTNAGALDSNKFSTSGLTAGIDTRVFDGLIVGAAVGYGLDHTDIGLRGTVSDASNLNGIVYASYKPFDSVYLDAVLGRGSLNFNNRRFVALDGTMVSGLRGGDTWFGSLSLTTEIKRGAFKIAPYARVDVMTAHFNQYSENGDPTQALTYMQTNINSTSGVLGLRGSVDITDGAITYSPNVRVEYRRAFDQGFMQSVFYNDLGASGGVYTLNASSAAQNIFTGTIGLRAHLGVGGTIELEYGLTGSPGTAGSLAQTVRAVANWNFVAQ